MCALRVIASLYVCMYLSVLTCVNEYMYVCVHSVGLYVYKRACIPIGMNEYKDMYVCAFRAPYIGTHMSYYASMCYE